jgi:hypothetical protein
MVYKGTIGTAERLDLPTTGVSIGDTYMVAESDLFAGIQAEVGDLFIATGTESEETGFIIVDETHSIEWTYVPAGLDTDTTYSLSAAGNSIVLKNQITKDEQAVELTAGSAINITTGSEGSSLQIGHATINVDVQDEGESSISHQGTFSALKSIEVNDQGHVTKVVTSSYTLPEDNDTTSILGVDEDNIAIVLTESNGDKSSVLIDSNDYIGIEASGNTISVNHKDDYAVNNWYSTPTKATPFEQKDVLEVVTGVTRDSGGHITGVNVSKIQLELPDDNDTTYSLSGATTGDTTSNSAIFTTTLQASNGDEDVSVFTLKSTNKSLDVSVDNNTTSIDLVWGSF